jgi:2-C-methyl-D-erythritol 4-phosphate cytidylyltransferase/2-C-methyl-D-erythritol 2,4-cyclodiphosphate synthase
MSVGVIIVAAGRGARMGAGVPKQLLDLDGRSILQHSVAAFDRLASIAELVVVLPPAFVAGASALIGPVGRPVVAVAGGNRRQDSVRAGLEAMPRSVDLVLVHDAARPFASAALIERVIDAARTHGAVVPAVPARDTVKRVPRDGTRIAETIARDEIWLAQTPQGFLRPVIERAVALGASGVEATDEAMLAERAGDTVVVVPGDERNMKITTPEDLAAARTAPAAAAPRVGTGYDLHTLADGRPLVLAGVVVAPDRGPVGHSDGDVVCHALVDAMLGAAGAGDIGRHFPNADPRWKDAPGLDLLARAAAIVGEAGWRVASADVTVVLERPKLASHVEAIRRGVADTLRIDAGAIGVKAKTNEGVDAVGRGEAIAAHAVAVLVPGAGR